MDMRDVVALRCDAAIAAFNWLYIGFAYLVVEYRLPHLTVCPFALLSGLRCPLCGTTRFIGLFLHGVIDDGVSRAAGFLWFVFIAVLTLICSARVVGYIIRRPRRKISIPDV